MRQASLLVLLLLAPAALAQAPAGPTVALELDVQDDHTERMALTFDGLRRLTRYENLCLPQGAKETRVHDELGDVTYEGKDEDGRRSVSFVARGEKVTVDMERPGPSDDEHPIFASDVNFCVPAGSRVSIRVAVPDRHTLFFLTGASELTARAGTTSSDGPAHVFYAYEAPLDARRPMTLVEEAPFRVFVSPSLAPQAQEVARIAAAPLREALEEAGLDAPFDAFRVIYTPETPLAWEAGHYSGHGYVQVKESTLVDDKTQGYPIAGARVLVHEAFHAASFPHGRGPVEDTIAWWLEGTAKHAERKVDAALPNATRHCEKTVAEVRCWDFDDRIRRADVERAYGPDFTFEQRWEPALQQDDATRQFYYAYSEYVVAAWIERHGVAEYQRAWDAIEGAFEDGEGCPCRDGWLVALLDDPQLFRPWEDVRSTSPQEFDAIVKPRVRDEDALQRELDARSNPLSGVPLPWWSALAALALVAFGRRAVR